MANTSATGGPLLPLNVGDILDDDALQNVFGEFLKGISGIPGNLVRPSGQQEAPNIPKDPATNWVAFWVEDTTDHHLPVEQHNSNRPTSDGSNSLIKMQTIKLDVDVYGPNSGYYSELIRSGAMIQQNREKLKTFGIRLTKMNRKVAIPELLKERMTKRINFSLFFSRSYQIDYPILNLLSSDATIDNEVIIINVNA